MSEESIIAQDHSTYDVFKARDRGDRVICGICGGEVAVVRQGEVSGPPGFGPGIYCLSNLRHIEIRLNVAFPRGYWDQFR